MNVDTTLKSEVIIGALLAQLPLFVAVAERRSFTAGARATGISPSAASQAIARLEQALGSALLVRTTRSVTLTDAGARLLSEARPALEMAGRALADVTATRLEPTGTLRLNVPRVACRVGLPDVIAELARKYPHLRVEVVAANESIDIVGEGFDAGIRTKNAIHKDMIRLSLTGPFRMVVVGSRPYFAAHGRPAHPRDLLTHACLGWRSFSGTGQLRWIFDERGRPLEVTVSGPLFADDADLMISCAARHVGLAYVAEPEVRAELASGKLETALDEYSLEIAGLFVYYARGAREIAKVRALVECVRALSAAKPAGRESPQRRR